MIDRVKKRKHNFFNIVKNRLGDMYSLALSFQPHTSQLYKYEPNFSFTRFSVFEKQPKGGRLSC